MEAHIRDHHLRKLDALRDELSSHDFYEIDGATMWLVGQMVKFMEQITIAFADATREAAPR